MSVCNGAPLAVGDLADARDGVPRPRPRCRWGGRRRSCRRCIRGSTRAARGPAPRTTAARRVTAARDAVRTEGLACRALRRCDAGAVLAGGTAGFEADPEPSHRGRVQRRLRRAVERLPKWATVADSRLEGKNLPVPDLQEEHLRACEKDYIESTAGKAAVCCGEAQVAVVRPGMHGGDSTRM